MNIKEEMNISSLGQQLVTYSAAYGDEKLPNCFGVIHHDGFDCTVQHFDLLWPLFLLILQDILSKQDRKEHDIPDSQPSEDTLRRRWVKLTGLHSVISDLILLHFAACSNPAFAQTPTRFLSWDHHQTGRGRNLMLKHKAEHNMQMYSLQISIRQIRFPEPSTNLVLSGLPGLSLLWFCRHRTQVCMAQTAWSSPHCTGAHRSLMTKPPSWLVV